MPIEKEKYAPRGSSYAVQEKFAAKERRKVERQCRQLHKECNEIELAVAGHSEEWKNQVAQDLMMLLGRAQYFLETDRDESDVAAAQATLRIVRRVAEFEGIRRQTKAPLTPENCPVCIRRAK